MNNPNSIQQKKYSSGVLKKNTTFIVVAVIFLFFALLTGGRLLYPQNLSNLILQNAYVLVLGCGMLLCILTGGNIDLSVGSTVCLTGAIAAQLLAAGFGVLPVVLICIAVACAIGASIGYAVGHLRLPPFICTLAAMFILRGIARIVLDSKTVVISDEGFLNLFRGYIKVPGLDDGDIVWSAIILGIALAVLYTFLTVSRRKKKQKREMFVSPGASFWTKLCIIDVVLILYFVAISYYQGISATLIWVIAIIILFTFITSRTVFGRYFYAVGGNEKATKLSGINTNKVYFFAYFLSSLMAGIAGMMVACRIGSVNGDVGTGYEMDAIAACFIGGASAYGGSGTVFGVVLGAILMGIINQGMSIYGIDNNIQYVVKGAILLIAVIIDIVGGRRAGKVWPHRLKLRAEK